MASRALRVPPVLWIAIMAGTVALLALLVTFSDAVVRADTAVLEAVRAQRRVGFERAVFGVTDLAGSPLLLVAVVAVVALVWARRWEAALAVVLAVGLTKAMVALAKALVDRPRPDPTEALDAVTQASFPSGHAASAAALYFTLTFLALRALPGPAGRAVAALGAMLVAVIGLTRVYLGVHYPLDVVAGWLTGGLLAMAAWGLAVRFVPRGGPGEVAREASGHGAGRDGAADVPSVTPDRSSPARR